MTVPPCLSSPRAGASRTLGVCLLALGLFAGRLEAAGNPSGGLDLVLLVDVSGSMSRQLDGSEGSDPKQKRWVAVQMILHLLTFDDRVLVIPFNHVAPAPQVASANLPDRLLPAEEARKALAFSVDQILARGVALDQGGTAIFGALQRAHQSLEASVKVEGNRRIVVLLTDGDDSMRINNPVDYARRISRDQDQRGLRTELDLWLPKSGREATPIYTIGLGPKLSDDLLVRISELTRGQYKKIESDFEIIETFRDLLWGLKSSWTRRVDLTVPGPFFQGLKGIVDIGVLSYDGVAGPGQIGPRARISAGNFSFSPPASQAPKIETRGQPGREPYAYFFTGRRSAEDLNPFEIDRQKHQLSLAWPGDGTKDDHLYFAVRTPNPLFRIKAPLQDDRFLRQERLRARVEFLGREGVFLWSDFDLTLVMSPVGFPAGTKPKEERLIWSPSEMEFQADLDLWKLPRRAGQPIDDFNLAIRADSKPRPDGSNALSNASLVVGSRTVAVENTFTVAEIPAIALGREQPSRVVAIQSVNREVRGDVPIRLKLIAPRLGPRVLGEGAIEVVTGAGTTVPLTTSGVVVNLRDGRADVTLRLRSEPFPAAGNYSGGSLTIASEDPTTMVPKSAPVTVQIDVVRLVTDTRAQELLSSPTPVFSEPIRIDTDKPVKLGGKAGKIQVELKPVVPSDRFTADEVWLETRAGAPRSQTLSLDPREPFRVGFHPNSTRGRVGAHAYTWEASAGQGLVPLQGSLSLQIAPPSLVVANPKVTVVASRGNRATANLQAQFDRPQEGDWPLYFEPDQVEFDRVVFARTGGPPGESAKLNMIYPGASSPILFDGKGQANFDCDVTIPAELPHGIYLAKGRLRGSTIKGSVPVEIELIVDDLVIEWFNRNSKQWEKLPEIKPVVTVGPIDRSYRTDLVLPIRVGTALGRTPVAANLKVDQVGLYENDMGDKLAEKQHPAPSPPKLDREKLRLEIKFPSVISVDKNIHYYCKVKFGYAGLDALELNFQTSFNP